MRLQQKRFNRTLGHKSISFIWSQMREAVSKEMWTPTINAHMKLKSAVSVFSVHCHPYSPARLTNTEGPQSPSPWVATTDPRNSCPNIPKRSEKHRKGKPPQLTFLFSVCPPCSAHPTICPNLPNHLHHPHLSVVHWAFQRLLQT